MTLISKELLALVDEHLSVKDDVSLSLLLKMIKDELKVILNEMFISYMTDKSKVRSSRH